MLGAAALADVRDTNRCCLRTATGKIVAPADAVVVPPPAGAFGDGPGAPADRPERDAVVAALADRGVAVVAASDGVLAALAPATAASPEGRGVVRVLTARGFCEALAGGDAPRDRESGVALLRYACRHLGEDWAALDGCRLLPLNGGGFGALAALPPSRPHLEAMGFSPAAVRSAVRAANGDDDGAVAALLAGEPPAFPAYFAPEARDLPLLPARTAADRAACPDNFLAPLLARLNGVGISPELAPDVARLCLAKGDGWATPWDADAAPASESTFLAADGRPTAPWYAAFWKLALRGGDPQATLAALGEDLPVLPTADGVACTLAKGNPVVARGDAEFVAVLARTGCVRAHACLGLHDPGHALFSYVHDASTRRGALAALRAAPRGVAESDAAAARAFLAERRHAADDADAARTARRLAIWPRFGGALGGLDGAVVLGWAPDGSHAAALDDTVVILESDAERAYAAQLGRAPLDRAAFFLERVAPLLAADGPPRDLLVAVLRDGLADAKLRNTLRDRLRVPTRAGGVARPRDLYDFDRAVDGGAALGDLLPDALLPAFHGDEDDALAALRGLGLRRDLDWPAVLACAAAVEASGDAATGARLLGALDARADALLGDGPPARAAKKPDHWFGRVFGGGDAKSDADAAAAEAARARARLDRAQNASRLAALRWLPVAAGPPPGEAPEAADEPAAPADDAVEALDAPATRPARPRGPENDAARLPWLAHPPALAAPSAARPFRDAWACSATTPLVDAAACGDARHGLLRRAFGWDAPVAVETVARQLAAVAAAERSDGAALAALVPRLYGVLDASIRADAASTAAILAGLGDGCPAVYVAAGTTRFARPDDVAFFGGDVATAPYLHRVPPDLACFRHFFEAVGVRERFGPADYAGVLQRLKRPDGAPLARDDLDLALRLVFALGADASLTAEKCVDMDVLAPDEAGALRPCRELVFDDAPWLRDAKADFIVTHPTVAAAHARKLGARSLRRALLDRGLAAGAERASIFGDNVETEAFGQRESLTRRLAHILQLYPEGSGILNELVQNADDAGASEVRVLLDARSSATRGAQSLLSAGLAAWQGPALCVSNDAGFTESDWRNLVRVGQGSKLENFKTTGRFGLGFNSVYHLTDVPQVASGDHVLFLDPHADGLVPGATPQRPGLRVKFTGGADLPAAFPDQFASWADCGCDLEKPLDGTLFRLPLRSRAAAATSEISKQHYGVAEAEALLEQFEAQATSVLLFLRHVRAVTVTVLRDDGERETVFRAAAREDPLGSPDVDGAAVLAGDAPRASADDPLAALGGATKAEFYARLLATPEASLPRRLAKVTVAFEERGAVAVEAYAVSSCVGGGAARAMACAPEHAGHKFVPFGAVAARLGAPGGGRCYTFLPVPVRTGLPVDVNGYFELSSNRRDVWYGEDMAGAGRLKSEWNVALLKDVVAVAYARLLLALGAAAADLWPLEAGAGPCWDACRAAVFDKARDLPLLTTDLDGGRAIEPKRCVAARAEDGAIADLLLLERLPVVALEPALHAALVESKCVGAECSPKFVRAFYAKSGATYAAGHARAGQRRASLATPEGVAALCAYALADAPADVAALPFNLTVDGSLGLLGGDGPVVSVADPATPEFRILESVVPRVLAHAAVAPVLLAKLPKASDATRAAPPDAAAVGRAVAKARFDAPPGDVVAWDPPAAGAGSRAWVGDVWAWLAANDAQSSLAATHALAPCVAGEGRAPTLARLADNAPPLFSPAPVEGGRLVAGRDDLGAAGDALLAAGALEVDVDVLAHADLAAPLAAAISPPTAPGVLRVLARAGDVDWPSDEHPRALRDWLAEAAAAGGALDGLPEAKIFKVLGSSRHAALAAGAALPPPRVDAALLKAAAAELDVLEESDRGSRDLLRALKWPRLDDEAFFARAAPAVAAAGDPAAAVAFLRDLGHRAPRLLDGGDVGAVVPCGADGAGRRRAGELYDPAEPGLPELLDADRFPAPAVAGDAEAMRSLRRLGLRRRLDHVGVLASARSVARIARDADDSGDAALKASAATRGRALLRILDGHAEALLEGAGLEAADASDDSGSESDGPIAGRRAWVAALRRERWVPTLEAPPDAEALLPWAGPWLCAPDESRPLDDAWACSASLGLVAKADEPRSEAALAALGWRDDAAPAAVAAQLVALAARGPGDAAWGVALGLRTPQLYGALGRRLAAERGLSRGEGAFQHAETLLRAAPWLWLGDKWAAGASVAFSAPEVADVDCLHECPAALAAAHGPLLRALGVREAFDAADFARALREGFPGGEPLGEGRAAVAAALVGLIAASGFESVDELEAAVGGEVLAPDSEGRLAPARQLAVDDAPWLSARMRENAVGALRLCHGAVAGDAALAVGARSLRALLLAEVEATQAVPCPAAPAAGDAAEAALPDVLAAADAALGARSVAVVFDARTHGAASLVHPALAGAQGPALVLWVDHDGPVGTEALVRLLSPGAAAVGRGLAGAFSLSDCLFALNRDTLHVFDPSGAFLDDGGGEKRAPGPAGRRYQLGDGDLMRKFPNQFEPFAHLPFGVSERGIAAGTILRLPLRGDFFVDGALDVPRVDGLLRSFEAAAERALLFGHALAGVTTHVFSGGNALLPRFSATRSGEKALPRDAPGAAAPGDARRRLLASDRAWLPKSKVGAFLGGLGAAQVFRPPALLYEFRVVVATYDGDGGCATRADAWLACGVLAPSAALREAAAAARDCVGRDAGAPLVTLAAKVDGESDGTARLSARGADAGVDLAGVLPNVFVDAPICVDGAAPATFAGGALARKPCRGGVEGRWNDALWRAALCDVLPLFLGHLKDRLPMRHALYRFWPRLAFGLGDAAPPPEATAVAGGGGGGGGAPLAAAVVDAPPLAAAVVDASGAADADTDAACPLHGAAAARAAARRLAAEPLFLSGDGATYVAASGGLFRADPLPFRVEGFLQRRMALLRAPAAVGRDLDAAAPGTANRATPAALRRALAAEDDGRLRGELAAGGPDECWRLASQLLDLCCADAVAAADDGSARGREARQRCWAEVKHLPLIPLEDGSVAACRPRRRVFDGPTTTTGAPLLATPRQSALCPGLARRVVRLRAARAAPALFDGGPLSLEFATAVGLERFTLATLAAELDAPWGDRIPDDRRHFLTEFWREVDFEDPHAVALFGNLPLIPLEGGGALACRHRDAVVAEPSDVRADDAALERDLAALKRAADAARREAAADEAAADAAEDELERRRCAEMGEDRVARARPRNPPEDVPDAPRAAEAPTPAGDRDRTRRLFGALRALGAPILEARYWPPDRRGAVVAAANGGSVKTKALRCLGAAPALKWDRLDGAATTALLEELHPCATSPSLVATLRTLPLFKTLGGTFAALGGEGDLEALSPRALDAVEPYAAPADLAGFLERPATAALRDLYADLRVPEIDVAAAAARVCAPRLKAGDLPPAVERDLVDFLVEHWDPELRRCQPLVDALAPCAFVPVGAAEPDRSAPRAKKRADELLDPQAHEALDAALVPAADCRSAPWLRLLRDLGLKKRVDAKTFLDAARAAAAAADAGAARRLLKALYTDHALATDDGLLASLAPVAFVPCCDYARGGDVVDDFASFDALVAPGDRRVAWLGAKVLRPGDAPPRVLWHPLGLKSPPAPATVLAHARRLAADPGAACRAVAPVGGGAHDAWRRGVAPAEAFGALFDYLDAAWDDLSPAVRAALPSFALVPTDLDARRVATVAAASGTAFLELPDDEPWALAPLLFEVPRGLPSRDVLERRFGVGRAPAPGDVAAALRRLGARRLDPNEVRAACRLVGLVARAGGAGDVIMVPDATGALRPASRTFFVDAPHLAARLGAAGAFAAHPRLDGATCAAVGCRRLSEAAAETVLAADRDGDLVGVEPSEAQLKATLRSRELATALAGLAAESGDGADADADDLAARLSGFDVRYVSRLETAVALDAGAPAAAARRVAHVDGAAKVLYVAARDLPRGVLSPGAVAAPALLRHLRLPPALAHGFGVLLNAPPKRLRASLALLAGDADGGAGADDRRAALRRGAPGAALDAADAAKIAVAPPGHGFHRGEVVALRRDAGFYYGVVRDADGGAAETVRVETGRRTTDRVAATELYVFPRAAAGGDDAADAPPPPPRAAPRAADAADAPDDGAPPPPPPPRDDAAALLETVGALLARAGAPPLDADGAALRGELDAARRALAAARADADDARADAAAARRESAAAVREPPAEFLCAITRECMVDPVIAADGFSYERSAIERWFRAKRTSPQTNAQLASTALVPNIALRGLIEGFHEGR